VEAGWELEGLEFFVGGADGGGGDYINVVLGTLGREIATGRAGEEDGGDSAANSDNGRNYGGMDGLLFEHVVITGVWGICCSGDVVVRTLWVRGALLISLWVAYNSPTFGRLFGRFTS
jgi:hypothetical protein